MADIRTRQHPVAAPETRRRDAAAAEGIGGHPDVPALLRELLDGQRALHDEVRELRALLETVRPIRPADRRRAEALLPALHEVMGDTACRAHELGEVAAMKDAVAAVLREIGCHHDLRPFGRFLARIAGANVGGYVVVKVADDRARGALWRIEER